MSTATVHLVRHGQVDNPTGVLYGRMPGYGLSQLGLRMADRLGEHTADWPLTHLRVSPLQRAQETMAPIHANHADLELTVDERVIEAANVFEGKVFSAKSSALVNPKSWWHLRNPLQPSWGEPYKSIVIRMQAAMADAAAAAGDGGTALVVAHQLPIWMARCAAEGRRLVHDPRKRECTLASITSFTVTDGHAEFTGYAEPCADLLPVKKTKKFVAGA
ncbi:histidine phosphatase family protein [Parenemella sanctibonifatiensis]|uniref:Histidine phosphatase family protein n=1 Tax=Parenemella sanctibonifatiensis TaxID=2016505 RepID=A0A255E580_9ACTN|nr:histidine phosphatase family protein [Parenemella sanctibonifatiensis]OYN84665.1 histidine phosphatase family protein [Parenemella sanctibonifatiensis]